MAKLYQETDGRAIPDFDSSSISGGTFRYEKLTISTQNIIPNLTYTPQGNAGVALWVSSAPQENGSDFTVSGKAVTWISGTAGFNVDPGDDVWALYMSTD